ncbi:MAG: ABC-type transport auxiliary lipoprotein family protein [Pseudomonadota bacterium]
MKVRLKRSFAIGAAAACLSACVSVFPQDTKPMQRLHLSAPDAPAADAAAADWQLLVDQPHSSRALDTPRIALMRAARTYEYMAGFEWSERAPSLMQSLLVQGFENSGKITGVARRDVGVRGDFALQSDLRRFEVNYEDGAPTALVALYVKLVRQPRGDIAASKLITAREPAGRGGADAIGRAFEAAAEQIVNDVVSWTLAEGSGGQADEASAPQLEEDAEPPATSDASDPRPSDRGGNGV